MCLTRIKKIIIQELKTDISFITLEISLLSNSIVPSYEKREYYPNFRIVTYWQEFIHTTPTYWTHFRYVALCEALVYSRGRVCCLGQTGLAS